MNLLGQKFGKLTVIEFAGINKHKQSQWKCICDCGNEVVVTGLHLKNGHTVSCRMHAKFIKHGKRNTRVYRIWLNMKNRCFNPNYTHCKDYGGRGITVCDEWKDDFQVFYDWAMANGYADNLSIDRINPDGNYEPSNCRWITQREQAGNKRCTPSVELDGEIHNLKEWSEITGINYSTIYSRYISGKTPAEILRKGACL